ncbi:MAG: hypothetical protein Q6368_009495 [Candidatus Baldrarchaeota archaeon]
MTSIDAKDDLIEKSQQGTVKNIRMQSLDGILQVLVIHRNGECLIRKSFTKFDFNEDLFSGFVSAAFTFAKDLGIGELQVLITKKVKICYLEENDIIFTVMANKNVDDNLIKNRLKLLKEYFFSRYRKVSGKWNGNLKDFRDLHEIIDIVFGDWQLDKNVRFIINQLREKKMTAIEAAKAIIELSRKISKLGQKT